VRDGQRVNPDVMIVLVLEAYAVLVAAAVVAFFLVDGRARRRARE
jgi:hypothetical protein